MDNLSPALPSTPASNALGDPGAVTTTTTPQPLEKLVDDWHAFTAGCSPEQVEQLGAIVHRQDIPNVHQGSDEEKAAAHRRVREFALHCISKSNAPLLCAVLHRGGIERLSLADAPKVFAQPKARETLAAVLMAHPSLKALDLGGNLLGDKGLEVLVPALTALGLIRLDLRANSLDATLGLVQVRKILHGSRTLAELGLAGNDFSYRVPIKREFEPIAVKHLDGMPKVIANYMSQGSARPVMDYATAAINAANLDFTDAVGATTLGIGIRTCTSLTSLDLSGCNLGPVFVTSLAAMAVKHLGMLKLANNRLQGDAGAFAVRKVMELNPGISSLAIEGNLTPPQTDEEALRELTLQLYQNHAATAFSYSHPSVDGKTFKATREMQTDALVDIGSRALAAISAVSGKRAPDETNRLPDEINKLIVTTALTQNLGETTAHGKFALRTGPLEGMKTLANLDEAATPPHKKD
jgi:hypothetical protein